MGLSTSKPVLTEQNLPDQTGKVFIVTGATGGVGKELVKILYAHNAKVYLAARSSAKADEVISSLQTAYPSSSGHAIFLQLDLDDLTTIKSSAKKFLAQEKRLDVLWNNAGVMVPPSGSVTKQDYELQLGTNNLGPFLFTKLLTPLLVETARTSAAPSVRVIWVSSSAAKNFAPQGGVDMGNLDYKNDQSDWHKYGVSKAANILQGKEFAKRYADSGVLSLSLDPGFLKTDLYKDVPRYQQMAVNLVLKDPIYGAYTELFAGLSEDISSEHNGSFVKPWGKLSLARDDIELSAKSTEEGGTGVGSQFWNWCEMAVQSYL